MGQGKEECYGCSTQCLSCKDKPQHHRDMKTIRHTDAAVRIPVVLALNILNEAGLSPETRRELIDCIQDA